MDLVEAPIYYFTCRIIIIILFDLISLSDYSFSTSFVFVWVEESELSSKEEFCLFLNAILKIYINLKKNFFKINLIIIIIKIY